ncbi:efflux RND transporter periplasmic adaptor subunit [Thermomonas hydrothermalis]|uniref:RND family efflux transporter, MFP subunit n=1 Tax=Thermomonas hydrothermalis TaxID=213588 RepID=A0A1M5AC72_9GAMM|nr:efflux RND transporter periplasmic adaptor subunit [Thermomonas hydrothermalis]SHF27900.1 RND family efflux transporter, MFP subunit [Thermomonas hydrothermalis]
MTTSAELLNALKIDRNAAPPPSRKGLWIGLAVAGVVLVVGAVIALRAGKPVAVRTAEVVAIGSGGAASAAVLDASGYVVARRMATVSAKITGRVREVLIEEGQKVKEGQVLARLDPVDAEAQRALSASQLAASESQIASVQAQLTQAEADAARLATLVQQSLVSRAQYEQALAQRDTLRAQLATARRNAQVAAASLRIADNGVDNTVVRAPFDGVIIAKAAQPGEIVSPLSAGGGFTRTGIGTLVDMESLEVEVEVGEAYIGRVKPGMPTQTALNAYPDWKIPGKVIAIIPAADRGKATVKVRVSLDARGDPRIVPDMGARVSFLEEAAPQQRNETTGVLVPAAAIVRRGDKDVAFVVSGGKVVERPLVLGRTLGDDRQVLRGLSAGEQVVLEPPETLADGMRVTRAADDEEQQ